MAVVTDNDGKYEHKIKEKYKDFDSVPCLLVCASVDNTLKTLEHQFVRVNTTRLSDLRTVLDIKETEYPAEKDVSDYMEANKTEWALNVFQSDKTFEYPAYILKAIDWVHEGE